MPFFPHYLKILFITEESELSKEIFSGLSQSDFVTRISVISIADLDWNEVQSVLKDYNRIVYICTSFHSVRDVLYIPMVLVQLAQRAEIHFTYIILENKVPALPDYSDFALKLINEMELTLILRFRKVLKNYDPVEIEMGSFLPTLIPLVEDILTRGYTGEFLMINSAEESPRLYTLYPGRLD